MRIAQPIASNNSSFFAPNLIPMVRKGWFFDPCVDMGIQPSNYPRGLSCLLCACIITEGNTSATKISTSFKTTC